MFNPRHGVYPILDAALLIREHRDTLDWERILAFVRGSWAALPLHLMLWYLDESDLSPIPPHVLDALGTRYCHLNRHSRAVLKRVISTCVIEGRFVKRNEPRLQLVWTSLVRPKSLNGYLRSIAHRLARPAVARRVGIADPQRGSTPP